MIVDELLIDVALFATLRAKVVGFVMRRHYLRLVALIEPVLQCIMTRVSIFACQGSTPRGRYSYQIVTHGLLYV